MLFVSAQSSRTQKKNEKRRPEKEYTPRTKRSVGLKNFLHLHNTLQMAIIFSDPKLGGLCVLSSWKLKLSGWWPKIVPMKYISV